MSKATAGPVTYYLEEVSEPAPGTGKAEFPANSNRWAVAKHPKGWTDEATRLPIGDKKDLGGKPILFEFDCEGDEAKCPKMGVAADREHIWVLGAFHKDRSEVRQYSRATNKHVKTYMHNLCRIRDSTYATRTGNDQKASLKYASPSACSRWSDCLNGVTGGFKSRPNMDFWKYLQGGTLAVNLQHSSDTALHIYGLSLCGTLFRIDPKNGEELVLASFLFSSTSGSYSKWTGLALQTMNLPNGKQSVRAWLSYDVKTKIREAEMAFRRGSGPDKDAERCGRMMVTPGSDKLLANVPPLMQGSAVCKIYVFDVTEAVPKAKQWWIDKKKHNKKTQEWDFNTADQWKSNSFNREPNQSSKPVYVTTEAKSLAYGNGFLYWYGGKAQNLLALDVRWRLDCEKIQSNQKVTEALRKWKTTNTATSDWFKVNLLEENVKMPWQIKFYKKLEGSGKWSLAKLMVCGKPEPPKPPAVPRPSQEACCVIKFGCQGKDASKQEGCSPDELKLL